MYTNGSDIRIACIGCGALVPDVDGPTFRYPGAASPGCWAAYGQVLDREYSEYQYPREHRLTVDAYAVQHPGIPTPQTIQSVTVHLISMCAVLEHGYGFAGATDMMRRAIERHKAEFIWLEPPTHRGAVTVLDVVQTKDVHAHAETVMRWANSVWAAWAGHHDTIHTWVQRLQRG